MAVQIVNRLIDLVLRYAFAPIVISHDMSRDRHEHQVGRRYRAVAQQSAGGGPLARFYHPTSVVEGLLGWDSAAVKRL